MLVPPAIGWMRDYTGMLTYADLCWRMYADVCMLTYADVRCEIIQVFLPPHLLKPHLSNHILLPGLVSVCRKAAYYCYQLILTNPAFCRLLLFAFSPLRHIVSAWGRSSLGRPPPSFLALSFSLSRLSLSSLSLLSLCSFSLSLLSFSLSYALSFSLSLSYSCSRQV